LSLYKIIMCSYFIIKYIFNLIFIDEDNIENNLLIDNNNIMEDRVIKRDDYKNTKYNIYSNNIDIENYIVVDEDEFNKIK